MNELKRCNKCGRELPRTAEYFYRNQRTKDGLTYQCKECRLEYSRAWRAANPEKVRWYYLRRKARMMRQRLRRQYARDYYWRNREYILERQRERRRRYGTYEPTPEEQDAAHQRRLERLLQAARARLVAQLWRMNNPDNVIVAIERRRAREAGLPDSWTVEHWRAALDYFDNRCAVCESEPGEGQFMAADHWIPLASERCPGTIPGNIVPLCHGVKGCNNSKGAKLPRQWLIERYGKTEGRRRYGRIDDFLLYMRNHYGHQAPPRWQRWLDWLRATVLEWAGA